MYKVEDDLPRTAFVALLKVNINFSSAWPSAKSSDSISTAIVVDVWPAGIVTVPAVKDE